MSLLPFVLAADNFPSHDGSFPRYHPETREPYTPFYLSAVDAEAYVPIPPVGLLRRAVLEALLHEMEARFGDDVAQWPFEFIRDECIVADDDKDQIVAVAFSSVTLAKGVSGMNEIIAATSRKWKDNGMFAAALDGECDGESGGAVTRKRNVRDGHTDG